MLLFALCFQDEHATQVLFTAINLSHNMPAICIWAFFKLPDLIHVFLAKNVFVIIENKYTGSHLQMPTKDI